MTFPFHVFHRQNLRFSFDVHSSTPQSNARFFLEIHPNVNVI